MKRKVFLLLLCLPLLVMSANAQTKSLLWQISGNGMSKPSYIYGTMHVSDKIAFHLTDSFFIALRSADIIALESNPESWIENDFGNNRSSNQQYNMDYYDEYYSYSQIDFYTEATTIAIPDNKTYAAAFADNSYLINGYLYRYNDNRGDYAEETYLDLFIFQCGKKMNKKIAALEGEQEVLKLLQKAYEPDEDEEEDEDYITTRKIMEELEEDGTNLYDQIDEAYRNGDLEKLDSLELITLPSKKYKFYFIEERNRNMVRRMDSIMTSGQTIFTGIGAAHLPGEFGALNLLREMGYTVTPVKGKITGKSIKEKDKIDNTFFVQTTNKQYSDDSLFTVNSPGKLYKIPDYSGNEFYLFPDMANSAYYTATRIKHRAIFKDMEISDVKNEIDRMLFENIPGDIQSKTDIVSNTGLQGYDIVSKTKRGNYLRFNIFISPLETFVFKVGGIGEFVIKSKESQNFFSSIKFKEQKENKWSTYSPAWGLFSIDLPPTRITDAVETDETVGRSQTICEGEATDNSGFYWFTAYYLNDDNFIEEDSFELVRITDMFNEQFKKNKFEKKVEQFLNHDSHPSLETVFNKKDSYLYTKVVITGPYYIFMAAMNNTDVYPAQYFNSLKLKDFEYNKEFQQYLDTALHFSVNTIVPKVDTILTFEDIDYGYNDYYDYGYNKSDEKEDLSYLPEYRNILFQSEATPENIFVTYAKFHKFFSETKEEEFWSEIDSSILNYSGMNMSRKKFTDKGNIKELEFMLTDTGSTRGIYNKIIVKDNIIFNLNTCVDTVEAFSDFVTNFYNSFTPVDSTFGPSIFESRSGLYFSQLFNEDSVLRKQAINSIAVIELEDKDADSLIKFIESKEFKKLKLDDRETFIDKLADLKNKNVIPSLKNIYMDAGDTSTIQLAVLKGLATIQTKESIKTFSELLYIETPLAKKGSSLNWIFTPLNDTLELAANLYPQLFDFTSLPEYQYATYRMLALISKNDSTKINLIESHKKQIIAEANSELKRSMAGNEVENKYSYSYNSYNPKAYFPKLKDITDGNGNTFAAPFADYSDYNYDYDNIFSDYYTGKSAKKTNYPWATNLLDYYSIILSNFYDDPAVVKYFTKINKSNDDGLIYRTSLTLAKNNLPVPDSIWTNLLKSREWRYFTIKQLQKLEQTNKLDTAFTTQLKIAEGCLYQYEFKGTEDSIKYISKTLVHTKQGPGYIYFFKSKIGNDKGWNLDCVGIQPVDQSQFEIEPMFVDYGTVILDEEDLQKKIDAIVKNIELLGRQRVSIVSDDYNYNYYEDY